MMPSFSQPWRKRRWQQQRDRRSKIKLSVIKGGERLVKAEVR